jgi:serine/threonine-protein kinase
MDYVDGITLHELIRYHADSEQHLPVQLALRTASEVAKGLHAAHELVDDDGEQLDLIHRDVSPQNVILGYDGVARVTDFGIAKAIGQSSKTATGVIKGKYGYMSPEQLRFEEPDRRSDLFSLGVVLYELLASKRLYKNKKGMDGVRRIINEPPPDILDERSDVPDAVVALLFQLLAKDRNNRPATAREVARLLDDEIAQLIMMEGALSMSDHLEEHFSEHRQARQEKLEAAMLAADERDSVTKSDADVSPLVSESARKPPPRGVWALAALVSLLGIFAAWFMFGGDSAASVSRIQFQPPAIVVVTFDSTPAGAGVHIDGSHRGDTPLSVVFTRDSESKLARVRKDGFAVAEERFTPDVTQRLRVALQAASATPAASLAAPRRRARPAPQPKKERRIRRIGESP